jgi:hypothetical protein
MGCNIVKTVNGLASVPVKGRTLLKQAETQRVTGLVNMV